MIELFVNGVFVGALYALFGLGLAVTFGLMQQINLAHGDFIVLSAYVAWLIVGETGVNPLLALPIVALAMFVVGYSLQRLVLNRAVGRGVMPPLLVTFGFSIVLQNSLLMLFSADTRSLDPGEIGSAAFLVGPLSIGVMPMFFFLFSLIVFAGTAAIFARTSFGRAVRATADDGRTARLMGIDGRKIFAVALGVSTGLSAIVAIFLGMRSTFSPSSGPERLLFAFEAVVLGGLGSVWGTFFGGLLLGIAQAIGLAFAPIYGPLAGHIIFLAALLVRPQGLLARRSWT
jgi:branched-chain amino acid transport system permease protein